MVSKNSFMFAPGISATTRSSLEKYIHKKGVAEYFLCAEGKKQ